MGLGDLGHAHAHLPAGNEVVAEQDEERILVDRARRLEDGVAEAARLILVDEGDGKRRGRVHALGLLLLAALAQHRLEVLVHREVRLDLGLLVRVDDDDPVDALGLERLLDDVLDYGLVENGKELLGGALGRGEKARAEAGGRDDCLHCSPFR